MKESIVLIIIAICALIARINLPPEQLMLTGDTGPTKAAFVRALEATGALKVRVTADLFVIKIGRLDVAPEYTMVLLPFTAGWRAYY